ncbi:MAG: type II secretion system F family protein [Planctomycetaceae bacterium]|nr:type II secretion system F family protein [Planctomycetaceae bacterium]
MTLPTTSTEPLLSSGEAEALVERVAQLGESGAPLVAGLRAAADEADSWRLARGLRRAAAEVERGRPLADVIARAARRLPPHLSGLIVAAQRTGQLGQVLVEWLENRRAAAIYWRRVIAALTYPAITLVLAVVIYILFALAIVNPIATIVNEFGMDIPINLNVIEWISSTGLGLLAAAAGIAVVLLILLRLIGGRAAWSWMITQLPLVGGTWHWTGVAEMLRSLALLVEHQVPLPEALRLTGAGIQDAYVGQLCRDLAARVEQGTPLFMAIVHQRSLPLSIVPLVRWGQTQGMLADGLKSAAEMLEGRLRIRSTLIVQVVPPLIFIIVGVMILSLVFVVLSLMFNLLQGLS